MECLIPSLPSLRKSTRRHSKPHWMQDFIVNHLHTCPDIDLSISFSPSHHIYLNIVSNIHEPCTYNQALIGPNWAEAMH